MTLSRIGRLALASVVSAAIGLGMTSCGGGTIGFMWVLGTQYNQVGGFTIDDYTGKLTSAVGSPYPSGGTNPIMLALKAGGRYLYVLNAGDSTGATGNFSLFSVGTDGTLSYQQSYTSIQGDFPVWITTDTTGNYLFVLNQHSPGYGQLTDPTNPNSPIDMNGSITVFPLDPNTGRPNVTQAASFEVGEKPTQMRGSASCIYTLDSADQTIFPSSLNSTTGQLASNPPIALNTTQATSVNIGGSNVYVTDAGSTTGTPGSIVTLTQGSSCAALTVSATVTNLPTASYPVQTISTTDGTYLYVLNHSSVNTNYANSSISAFVIGSGGSLTPDMDASGLNPYAVGSGPVCMAIDPTNQYLFTSDQFASTVTGKRISSQYGFLQDLTKGSSFPTVGTPSCLVISGNIGS